MYAPPVVQRVDNAIHWINHFPVDKCRHCVAIYPLECVIQSLNNWALVNMQGGGCK